MLRWGGCAPSCRMINKSFLHSQSRAKGSPRNNSSSLSISCLQMGEDALWRCPLLTDGLLSSESIERRKMSVGKTDISILHLFKNIFSKFLISILIACGSVQTSQEQWSLCSAGFNPFTPKPSSCIFNSGFH